MHGPSTLRVSLVLALSLGAAGCGSGSTQLIGPTATKCNATISGLPSSVPSDGGNVTATVSAARECGWTATSDATWLQLAPSSGQGPATITVRVSANGVAAPRSGSISVNGSSAGLAQEAAPCRFSLSSQAAAVPYTGGAVSVEVQATQGCGWDATGNSWIQVVRGSGSGSGTAEFAVAPNAGAARTAALVVAGIPWTVSQAAPDGGQDFPPPEPTPPEPEPVPPEPTVPVEVTLSGRASNVRGSCPNLEFTLDHRDVYTDEATSFHAGNCKHVEDGTELRVEGEVRETGRVYAVVVEIG